MDYDDFRNARRRRPALYSPPAPYMPPGSYMPPGGSYLPPGASYAPPGGSYVPPGASYAPPLVAYVPPAPPVQATPPLPEPPRPGINVSFRRMNVGAIVDVAAQAFASFAPLPAPPPPPIPPATFDPQNLVTYQTSLAQYAKRDEQLRFVGAIARMLFTS